jgi:thiamine pyrophosphokinase
VPAASGPPDDLPDGAGMSRTVVVVTGGDPPPLALASARPPGALVVAADRGVDHALALGWPVHVAVGDFDSASPAGLAAVARSGARIERHPAAKDRTDLDLALERAVELGATRLLVVGGHGGRLDHLLGNVVALASPELAGVEVTALMGDAVVHVVRGEQRLEGEPGDLVTLLALHEPAVDVRTEGLAFPLRGEVLVPGSSRGVSNVLAEPVAWVRLGGGVLLVVRPGREGPGPGAE